ncbi:MAG: hypothetical protein ACJAWV_001724 [Flammeovirgaceae bacterium]|jgi:hypothetical protein
MFIDIALAILLFFLSIPVISGYYAYTHGRSFWLWFVIGTFLPVVSYFILALLPDKSNPDDAHFEQMRIALGILGTSPDIPHEEPLRYQIKNAKISELKLEASDSNHKKYKCLDLIVSGSNLIERIQKVEFPYAKSANLMAGAYEGISLELLMHNPDYLLGGEHGKRMLLLNANRANNPNWNISAEVRMYRRVVVWCNFRQTEQKDYWRYDAMGVIVFDRLQYFDAIYSLVNAEK